MLGREHLRTARQTGRHRQHNPGRRVGDHGSDRDHRGRPRTACALVVGGAVECWGSNFRPARRRHRHGRSVPVAVSGSRERPPSPPASTTPARSWPARTIECWGWNIRGQLGDGTTTTGYAPVAVSGLSGATAIAGGWMHTCAIVAGAIRVLGRERPGPARRRHDDRQHHPRRGNGGSPAATAVTGGYAHTL